MSVVVISGNASPERARDVCAALARQGLSARQLDLGPSAGESSSAQLAGTLRRAEADFSRDGTAAVVLTSDDAVALAAALVATKLEISLFRIDVPPASGDDVTARIDTLLADRLVSGDPDQAAAAIAQELVANSPPRPGS